MKDRQGDMRPGSHASNLYEADSVKKDKASRVIGKVGFADVQDDILRDYK